MRFVSKSGRVIIEPRDHWIYYSVYFSKGQPLPEGFSAKWQVVHRFLDPIPATLIPPVGGRRQLQLAQGLADARHTLRLVMSAGSPGAFSALQVHSPSGQAAIRLPFPNLTVPEGRLQLVELPQGPTLAWTDPKGDRRIETSTALFGTPLWLPVDTSRIETQGNTQFLALPDGPTPTFFRLAPARAATPPTSIDGKQ